MPHDGTLGECPKSPGFEAKLAEARPTFEDFFGTEHARLFGALCFVTGDRDEAEEIMQDAFLRLWERWDQLRLDDASAYLFRTAMNVFRNRYRRTAHSLRKTLAIAPSDDAFETVDDRDLVVRTPPRSHGRPAGRRASNWLCRPHVRGGRSDAGDATEHCTNACDTCPRRNPREGR